VKESIISEQRTWQLLKLTTVIAASRRSYRNEKSAAIAEIKTQVAELSNF